MNQVIRKYTRYLYLWLVLVPAVILSGCSEEPVLTSGEELPPDLSVVVEQELDEKIAAEIKKAEATIQEYRNVGSSVSSAASMQQGSVLMVHPGESIQAAVDAADPGTTLLIKPGVYQEAVSITKSGLTLIGLGGPGGQEVVIQNPGDADDGVRVSPAPGSESVDGFAMYNITVRDFGENGVFLIRTNNYFIAGVTTINDGEYGIFPVRSNNGVIFRSSAEGHSDAGIYIGQSVAGWILNCEAHGNVIGVEIENSSDIVVAHNTSYGNTLGILAVLLPPISPFLTVFESENISMAHNRVFDNNLDNFAEPGEIASFHPKGMGLMVVGVDGARIVQNRITNNGLIGLGVGSILLYGTLAGLPPEVFEAIDPDPDNAEIKLNTVMNNGTSPPPLPAPLDGVEGDLFWDGSGDDNCWWNNTFDSSVPAQLPQCPSPGL